MACSRRRKGRSSAGPVSAKQGGARARSPASRVDVSRAAAAREKRRAPNVPGVTPGGYPRGGVGWCENLLS